MSKGAHKGNTKCVLYKPPEGLTGLYIRIDEVNRRTTRHISSLDDATFQWLGRVWLADSARRVAAKDD